MYNLFMIFFICLQGVVWDAQNCQKADLYTMKKESLEGKNIYMDVKFQQLQGDYVILWKSTLNFVLSSEASNPKELNLIIGKLNPNDNVRLFGKLIYSQENQSHTFYIFHAEKYKSDIELYLEIFEEAKQEGKKISYFYKLADRVTEVALLHSSVEPNKETKKKERVYNPQGQALLKLHHEISSYALQKQEEQVSTKDFKGQMDLYKNYLKLGNSKKALEKILLCYEIQPSNQKVIGVLQKEFKRVRFLKNGKISWVSQKTYYKRRGYRDFKGEWLSPGQYELVKKVDDHLSRSKFFYSPSPKMHLQFEEQARKTREIKERYGQRAVIYAWGYPAAVFRYVTDQGRTYELWKYPEKGGWIFFEQGPKEIYARVISFFPQKKKKKNSTQ